MRVIIIPHNTSKIREIRINKLLIIILLLFIIISFTSKYLYQKESLNVSKLKENNDHLERNLHYYEREYRELDAKYTKLLVEAKKRQNTVLTEAATERQNNCTVDELMSVLKEYNRLLENINSKLKSDASLANCIPSIIPVKGYLIQTFGPTHDIFTGQQRFCQGIDIAAPKGTEIYAPAYGIAKFTGIKQHAGLMIVIEHGRKIETRYSHLSLIKVKKYQYVKRGDIIGLVGTTGKTIGPRLHYEVWVNGEPKDPLDFIL
ncbi:MAG: M23 family metallopeptidase [bacterium]|nr:M23 family metallopeptidase [bacterium]